MTTGAWAAMDILIMVTRLNNTFTDPTPDDGLNEYVMNLDANKWFYYGGEGTVLNLDGNGSANRCAMVVRFESTT